MNIEYENLIRIFLAAICGCILGFERKSHSNIIGMRTLTLICVSSALLSILSSHMAISGVFSGPGRGDPTRIAAGVVSGIGFLGGGVIIKQGINIKGLTSAAIIFITSAIGLSVGNGMYFESGLAILIAIILLLYIEKFELKFFPFLKNINKKLLITYRGNITSFDLIESRIKKSGIMVDDYNFSYNSEKNQTSFQILIKVLRMNEYKDLSENLKSVGDLLEFSIASE